MKIFSKSKFKNIKTKIDGLTFDSKLESKRYEELKILKLSGMVKDYQMQVKFPIVYNGFLICTYKADFVVSWSNGEKTIEDCKGVKTPVYNLKKKLLKIILGIEIVEIFQKNERKIQYGKFKKRD